ncbi:MAG: sensor histidine kinase [Bacteroidota bacterium]
MKTKIGPILICFLLCFYLPAKSESVTDSLERILKTALDTNKINLLNKLSTEYCESNSPKALNYAYSAIALSKQYDFPIGLAKAYNNIGIVHDITGNYDSALINYNTSLKISKTLNNKKQVANTLNNIGLVYWNKGEFDIALDYYLQSLKLFEIIGNKKGVANTLSNLGLIYYDLHKFTEALNYHQQSLKIREELNDKHGIGVSQTNIGMAYGNLNNLPKALEYLKMSLETKKQNNDLYGQAISLSDIGVMYNELKQHDTALKYQLLALPIRIQLNDKFGVATSYSNIATCYIDKKDFKTALDYSLKGLQMALEINSKTKLKKIYFQLSLEYKKLNDFKKSLDFFEKYAVLNDKIYSEESAAQIAEMQTKYETEKKDLDLAKKNLVINNHQLELTQQKSQRTILLISILGLTLLFYLLYARYRFKQRYILNQEMLKQQELRSKAVIEAEENERTRIARELHDGLGQHLSAVKLNLSNLQSILDLTKVQEKTMMQNALSIVDESVKEVRTVSHNMMPNTLLKSGLEVAVREFIDRINSSGSLKIEFQVHQLSKHIDSTIEIILYRVLQEIVNNVMKHAEATVLNIQIIQHENELTLMAEDNGIGFDRTRLKNEGIGLKNIQSRISYLNGTVEFDTQPGKGTTVSIEIPLKKTYL